MQRNHNNNQIAKNIKKRREIIGVSQKKLAEEAKVSYRTALRFEKGESISDKMLAKINGALERLEKSGQKPDSWWLSHKETGGGNQD